MDSLCVSLFGLKPWKRNSLSLSLSTPVRCFLLIHLDEGFQLDRKLRFFLTVEVCSMADHHLLSFLALMGTSRRLFSLKIPTFVDSHASILKRNS